MKPLIIILGILIGLILLVWIGLQIQPKPFPPYKGSTVFTETVPLPTDLPDPVYKHFQQTIGDEVPVIESAVITGRARLRFMGITFPSRFRFTHVAGQDYRHYIEATIFGFPIMKVNEHYLDGHSRLELPFGVVENEPKVDSAANLGLWAESVWLPSIFITDPRLRWEPIDERSAKLVVPFGDSEDEFIARFNPNTGLLVSFETTRWKEATDPEKTPWATEARGWVSFHNLQVPSTGTVFWLNESSPWAVFNIEEVVYNVDVSEYVRAKGP
jgi:hypothetical protein